MFEVSAGKYENDGTLNYKYIESFETIDAALTAMASVKSYPWSKLTIKGNDFVYQIDPVKIAKRTIVITQEGPQELFMPCNDEGELIPT